MPISQHRLILEQQVSLLSARAAFMKLRKKVGRITPKNILQLTDKELRESYVSRQKTSYLRNLAKAILDGTLSLNKLKHLTDDLVIKELVKIKGIGNWTAESYLLLCLRRTDIFPIGDIALRNSIRKIKKLPAESPHEKMLSMAESWRPYRSIATQLFWHAYLIDKKADLSALNY
jgi:DNA-3-methyladenine glycosylase II